jgi:hypothetical protein
MPSSDFEFEVITEEILKCTPNLATISAEVQANDRIILISKPLLSPENQTS